jgi:outer membrane protein assembly factor BamB
MIKILVFALLSLSLRPAAFPNDVLTWHSDNARTGQNLNETVLIPGNVNATTFGKLFTIEVDGKVDAEPLYVERLSIPKRGVHNALFIATEHDSFYAVDPDSGESLWHRRLLTNDETPSDNRNCS